jgi:hypothetical protein
MQMQRDLIQVMSRQSASAAKRIFDAGIGGEFRYFVTAERKQQLNATLGSIVTRLLQGRGAGAVLQTLDTSVMDDRNIAFAEYIEREWNALT